MKVFIIGYMGSGKTQMGHFLAKKLGYSYADLDIEIEKQENLLVSEIFSKYGEEYFRKIEKDKLHSLVDTNNNIVISTGGGTPCFFDNMNYMNEKGLTIYLKVPVNKLIKRLARPISQKKRPILNNLNNEEEIKEFITKHLAERENKYYSKSNLIIDITNISFKQLYDIVNYTIWIKEKK